MNYDIQLRVRSKIPRYPTSDVDQISVRNRIQFVQIKSDLPI